ncbi:MAG: hypothetical protein JWN44_3720 [Myxococcales bacterium]|nr:hypothetical protein [Myxococcales bacterium]
MRLRRYLALTILGALLALPAGARAQGAVNANGGIKLGDVFVLHLGMGTEVQWDSNIFYESKNESSAFVLRLSPGFDLTNAPRQASRQIRLDLHGTLNYLEYLTGDKSISQHRQFSVDAGLQAAFFATNPYNFTIFDNYVRTTQPPYLKVPYNLDRDTNQVGVRVNLSPGGGRLSFYIGYLFGIDFFEVDSLKAFDTLYHSFELRASWRFLPKTAVYIAAGETIYTYPHPGVYAHPASYPFHIQAGLQGLITTKLTVNLWVGYGNGFYVSGPSPNTAVGGLALTWKPTMLSSGTLGYQHDFQNSLLGSYFDVDQVYASWTQLIWRFTGFLRIGYANQRYQGIQPDPMTQPPSAETNPNRADNIFTLNARGDYPFKDWLFGSVGYDLALDRSNGMLNLGNGVGQPGLIPVDYTKHVVYLRLTVSY